MIVVKLGWVKWGGYCQIQSWLTDWNRFLECLRDLERRALWKHTQLFAHRTSLVLLFASDVRSVCRYDSVWHSGTCSIVGGFLAKIKNSKQLPLHFGIDSLGAYFFSLTLLGSPVAFVFSMRKQKLYELHSSKEAIYLTLDSRDPGGRIGKQ